MAAQDAMFTIDSALEKMRECMDRVQAGVGQLRESADEKRTAYAKHVDFNDKTVRMMAAYLSAVGRFRGQSADEIIQFFRDQALTPKKDDDDGKGREDQHEEARQPGGLAVPGDVGGDVPGQLDASDRGEPGLFADGGGRALPEGEDQGA